MKKIFVQYSRFYPAYKAGGPIQSLMYLLEKINGCFDVYLVTSCYDFDGKKLDVVADCWVKTRFGNVFYSSGITYNLLKDLITEINPHVFYLNSFFSILTVKTLCVLSRDNRKIVIAPRGEFSPNALLWKRWKKNAYLFLFKHFLISDNLNWHFTNVSEFTDCSKLFSVPELNYKIVSNLHPVKLKEHNFANVNKRVGILKIVSVGRVSPMKNMSFLIDVISKASGNVICDIYGFIENQEYYLLCKEKLRSLPENIEINFKGDINSKDVVDIISKYDLFFSPSLGENFGHAIFEGLIAGLPILISDKIPFFSEVESFMAGFVINLNNEEAFVEKINDLILYDEKQYLLLKQNVFRYIQYLDNKTNDIKVYLEMFK